MYVVRHHKQAGFIINMLPEQQSLLFPLLETLHSAGGEMRPQRVYDELAERVGLSDEDRNATTTNGAEGRLINAWERRVRNTRQQAVTRGMIESAPERRKYNVWALTEDVKRGLLNCKAGVCITIYTTEYGESVWAECETAMGLFADRSIDHIAPLPAQQPEGLRQSFRAGARRMAVRRVRGLEVETRRVGESGNQHGGRLDAGCAFDEFVSGKTHPAPH
jgi:hypothetical protein